MQLTVPEDVFLGWQGIVDLMADLAKVPSALIMRFVDPDIEVFAASHREGNPYHVGESEHLWGSGLYCEEVIKTKKKLLVQNALADENWRNNPDIKLNMISYLGFPLLLPDGTPFGTICVLDNKENVFSEAYEALILKFRELIHMHLELLNMNYMLGEKNKRLSDYLPEIQELREFIPICSYCKKVRDDKGYWEAVELYISKRTEAKFTHGLCPECSEIFLAKYRKN